MRPSHTRWAGAGTHWDRDVRTGGALRVRGLPASRRARPGRSGSASTRRRGRDCARGWTGAGPPRARGQLQAPQGTWGGLLLGSLCLAVAWAGAGTGQSSPGRVLWRSWGPACGWPSSGRWLWPAQGPSVCLGQGRGRRLRGLSTAWRPGMRLSVCVQPGPAGPCQPLLSRALPTSQPSTATARSEFCGPGPGARAQGVVD